MPAANADWATLSMAATIASTMSRRDPRQNKRCDDNISNNFMIRSLCLVDLLQIRFLTQRPGWSFVSA
jgi:hypothetical protein